MQVELDADGFAESYTVEGCSNPAHCGVFRRVDAHCTSTTRVQDSRWCPGGRYANGNSDDTKCDGAPVYQRVGEGGGVDGAGPVLYRVFFVDYTRWGVGPSDALADCFGYGAYSGGYYLLSLPGSSGAPTAPGYSAGDGWTDYDNNGARGTISVAAGGDSGGGH
eukprot:COSAG06_NODE_993_length_11161_cov_12.065359_9_plen_164_part_00